MREERQIRPCKTSFVAAAETCEHALVKKGKKIHVTGLESLNEANSGSMQFQAARNLLQKQGDLKFLPQKLRDYLQDSALTDSDKQSQVLNVKSSGTLCATPAWAEEGQTVLQCVRATPDCQNKPWYDSVRVHTEEGTPWYCELRLMFEFAGEKLAYVRWYDVVTPLPSDILCEYGCTSLTLSNQYDVIPLESVQCREYIVPDFKTRNQDGSFSRYHVSAFKWDRFSVGFKDDEVDEHGVVLT